MRLQESAVFLPCLAKNYELKLRKKPVAEKANQPAGTLVAVISNGTVNRHPTKH